VSAQAGSAGSEGQNTLQLYCPYDRKVTRHVRRGTEQTVTCLECGRRIDLRDPAQDAAPDAVHVQRTAAMPLVVEPTPLRPHRTRRKRSSLSWLPPIVGIAVALLVAFAAFNMVGRLLSPSSIPAPTSAAAPTSSGTRATEAPAAPVAEPQTSVRIANTDGQGAFLRRTPNLDDRMPRAWIEGTTLTVIGPDTTANGTTWKHVEAPDGSQGWIPTQYTGS